MNDLTRAVIHELSGFDRSVPETHVLKRVGPGADSAVSELIKRGFVGVVWGDLYLRPAGRKLVTYQKGGRQYVAVASGNSGGSIPLQGGATVLIFGL